MSDPLRRALRTFLQGFVAVLIASPAFQGLAGGEVDLSAVQRVLVAGVGAGVTALLSFAQNFLEDASGTSFLVQKAVRDPEPTQPDPEPVLGTEVPPS